MFCTAATIGASIFAFFSVLSLNLSIPCHCLASPKGGSTHTPRLRSACSESLGSAPGFLFRQVSDRNFIDIIVSKAVGFGLAGWPGNEKSGKGGSTLNCKDRLEDYLRKNAVPFEVQHHPRVVTAQEVAATEHIPGKMLAKTIMVLADGEMSMLALPAPYEVDLEKVGEALGAREVRLAEEEEFEN